MSPATRTCPDCGGAQAECPAKIIYGHRKAGCTGWMHTATGLDQCPGPAGGDTDAAT
jgi:hypothetical protein